MIRKSFTLIEIIIAVALSLVVTTMIATVYQQTGRVTRGLNMRSQISDELRTVLSIITQDLAGYYGETVSAAPGSSTITEAMDGDATSFDFTTTSAYSASNYAHSGHDSDDYLLAPFAHVRYHYEDNKLYRSVSSQWTSGSIANITDFTLRSNAANNVANGTTDIADAATNDVFLVSTGVTLTIEYRDEDSWETSMGDPGFSDPSNLIALRITIEKADTAQDTDAVTTPVNLQQIIFLQAQ